MSELNINREFSWKAIKELERVINQPNDFAKFVIDFIGYFNYLVDFRAKKVMDNIKPKDASIQRRLDIFPQFKEKTTGLWSYALKYGNVWAPYDRNLLDEVVGYIFEPYFYDAEITYSKRYFIEINLSNMQGNFNYKKDEAIYLWNDCLNMEGKGLVMRTWLDLYIYFYTKLLNLSYLEMHGNQPFKISRKATNMDKDSRVTARLGKNEIDTISNFFKYYYKYNIIYEPMGHEFGKMPVPDISENLFSNYIKLYKNELATAILGTNVGEDEGTGTYGGKAAQLILSEEYLETDGAQLVVALNRAFYYVWGERESFVYEPTQNDSISEKLSAKKGPIMLISKKKMKTASNYAILQLSKNAGLIKKDDPSTKFVNSKENSTFYSFN